MGVTVKAKFNPSPIKVDNAGRSLGDVNLELSVDSESTALYHDPSGNVSDQNFSIRLRHGNLKLPETLKDSNWVAKKVGTDFYLLSKNPVTITNDGPQSITLGNIHFQNSAGNFACKPTTCRYLCNTSSQGRASGFMRSFSLEVIRFARGMSWSPSVIGFLTNSGEANDLTVYLTNTGLEDIDLDKDIALTLGYYVDQGNNVNRPDALSNSKEKGKFSIDGRFTGRPPETEAVDGHPNLFWKKVVFNLKALGKGEVMKIKTGDFLKINISELTTELSPRKGSMYVKFEGVSGYENMQMVVPIEIRNSAPINLTPIVKKNGNDIDIELYNSSGWPITFRKGSSTIQLTYQLSTKKADFRSDNPQSNFSIGQFQIKENLNDTLVFEPSLDMTTIGPGNSILCSIKNFNVKNKDERNAIFSFNFAKMNKFRDSKIDVSVLLNEEPSLPLEVYHSNPVYLGNESNDLTITLQNTSTSSIPIGQAAFVFATPVGQFNSFAQLRNRMVVKVNGGTIMDVSKPANPIAILFKEGTTLPANGLITVELTGVVDKGQPRQALLEFTSRKVEGYRDTTVSTKVMMQRR